MRMFLLSLFATLLLAAAPASAQPAELPLGSPLPMADQAMIRADGSSATLGQLVGTRGTVVVFWSNQCPWVDKYQDRLKTLVDTYAGQGFAFVLVNANDPSAFPQESAAESQKRAQQLGTVTYLLDPEGAFAAAIGASRAPHLFMFDANRNLAYVGTIDDSPGDPGNVGKTYLKDALDALSQGNAVAVSKTKAFGCMLKTARG